ncbi:hypothetical protein BD770DRAFT_75027 [Pilaira anomala]|nr:hypothetical protein BD770DRAFT_75027 [Pilaira anomala]
MESPSVTAAAAAAASGSREGEGVESAQGPTTGDNATATGANTNVNLNQEMVKTFYLHLRQKHAEVNEYLKVGCPQRHQILQEINNNLATLECVYLTASPSQQAGIMPMVNNLKWEKQRIENEINHLESIVDPELQWLATQLGEMACITGDYLKTLFVDYSWPTIQDCYDLRAPQEVFNLMVQGNGVGLPHNYLQTNNVMAEVRAYVQQALGQVTNNRPMEIDSKKGVNDSTGKADNFKRYRKIIPFDPKVISNSEDARVWLSKYQWYSQYDGISEEARMRDLPMYLDGMAFTWFATLPDPTQKSWDLFSGCFL